MCISEPVFPVSLFPVLPGFDPCLFLCFDYDYPAALLSAFALKPATDFDDDLP